MLPPPRSNWVITVLVLVKAAVKSSCVKALGLTKKPANAGFGAKVVKICAAGRRGYPERSGASAGQADL